MVKLRDFFVVDMGRKANSLIIVEYEAFKNNLFDRLNSSKQPECVRRLVNWAYQVNTVNKLLIIQNIFVLNMVLYLIIFYTKDILKSI